MILDYNLSLSLCLSCAQALCPPVQLIANEQLYLPMLKAEIDQHWPTVPWKAPLGAQVRQETCASLKHKKCWSPTAELKTDREYGFGLGQITVTSKFDNFKEAKKLHPSMKDWEWENRYNAEYQLRTLVLMNRFSFNKLGWADSPKEQMALTFAAYNGGLGGVLSDRAVCRGTPDCNVSKWFGNIEHTSRKSKVSAKGYGLSFFEINRMYVKHIMGAYRERYLHYFGECANG